MPPDRGNDDADAAADDGGGGGGGGDDGNGGGGGGGDDDDFQNPEHQPLSTPALQHSHPRETTESAGVHSNQQSPEPHFLQHFFRIS